MTHRFTDAELQELKERNLPSEIAGQWVTLRRAGRVWRGPCPICSKADKKTDGRFEAYDEELRWVCAACPDGGDVIRLVMKREGVDFVAAVERLGGVREAVITPEMAKKQGERDARAGKAIDDCPADYRSEDLRGAWRDGFDKGKRAEAAALRYRERERARLYKWWKDARPFPGTPVAAYLAGRGLIAPGNARLKFAADLPMFADGRENEPELLHRGPAMLAAILDASGHFSGLHMTWLDPAGPKGKAQIVNPHTGEVVPSKKVRGTKQGGYIDLGGDREVYPTGAYRRLFAGEGIETVLAVYTSLYRSGRLRAGDGFRSGVDLGNLCGKATATVRHPDLKDAAGRARRVPGDDPDMNSPAMPVPGTVEELVLLGDGDSDSFTTRNALARAAQRHSAPRINGAPSGAADHLPSRKVRTVFAPDGKDFNDLLVAGTAGTP